MSERTGIELLAESEGLRRSMGAAGYWVTRKRARRSYPVHAVVDGVRHAISWDEPTFIPLAAGHHALEVAHKMMWRRRAGRANATISLCDGEVRRLVYKKGWLTARGRLEAA